MPQTLLALGALSLMGLVAFGHQRARTHDQQRIIRNEIEVMAQSVSEEIFEALDVLPFDAVRTNNASALTPEAEFGLFQEEVSLADLTDLDDVHGATLRLDRILAEVRCSGTCATSLEAAAVVRYAVEQSGELVDSGGAPSFAKEVSIMITHDRLLAPVSMSRVYTAGWIAD